MRAIAILIVLAWHARSTPGFPAWLAAARVYDGGLGVDIFFVISGFLITRLLVQEEGRNGRISLKGFYYRRALRILPAALAYLGVVGMLSAVGIGATPLPDLASSALFCRNLFGDSAFTGHFWSLSVEEQFYLVWPALFFLLPARVRLRTALVLLTIAPFWRLFNLHVLHPSGLNLGRADLRYDVLTVGVVLALAPSERLGEGFAAKLRSHGDALVLAGAALLLAMHVAIGKDITPVALSFRNIAIGAVVYGATSGSSRITAMVLDAAPLRFIGRISYSLYLWQQLFLFYWTFDTPWFARFPVNLGPTCIAALGSYYLVEQPILAWRDRARVARETRAAPAVS